MAALPDGALAACRLYFREASGDFVARKEFGYSWAVRGASIEMHVADYLSDAPEDVLREFCGMVCQRARGRRCPEPPAYLEHVRSDPYIVGKRPTYVRRSRNLARTAEGGCANLLDSVQRLLDSGLLDDSDIANSYMSWTRRDSVRRVGFCSTMFRVVGVSARLDSEDVPDLARDYVVYHECLHLRQGYRPGARVHDAEFRGWERSFPRWREAEDALKRLGPVR